MNLPQPDNYIDIHTHDGVPADDAYIIESLMAHEIKTAEIISGRAYTIGIHPWFLNENNHKQLISSVESLVYLPDVIAVGEAGFDKLRGPSLDLQREAFEEQVEIAEEHNKPVIIHCVRAWEEILASHKKLKPKTSWLIHGFRGNKELAGQLLSRGMYLSFWFDFVIRPESAVLLRSLPKDRIFFETDGAGINIKEIYSKAATDLELTIDEMKVVISNNFKKFFNIDSPLTTLVPNLK
jgi:TatD DNase family protein